MLGSTFTGVLVASLLAAGITTAGIVVISRYESWGRKHRVYFMAFASGVLICISFMHIIPRSFRMATGHLKAPAAVMLGFFGLYLLNRFLHVYLSRSDEMDVSYSIGLIPMLGIGLHSLLDGAIYSVTFNVSIFTGALAAIGMVLHEFPEGIITFVLLERGGFSRARSMLYAFLAAGISTPAGALISYPFVHRIEEPLLGLLLALSGGALLYVGGPHLLPAVEEEPGRFKTLAIAAGVAVAMLIIFSKH